MKDCWKNYKYYRMNNNKTIGNLGETHLVKIISNIILNITGKTLTHDDSFYFNLPFNEKEKKMIVLNSDMFVSTTDAPLEMTYYHLSIVNP